MKLIKRLILLIFIILIISTIVIGIYGYLYYREIIEKVPISSKVTEIRNEPSFVKIEDIPDFYKNATVAVEDHRFYKHSALDIIGIIRATVTNAKNKEFQEGGSTITQQVAKNMYFINDNEVVRRKVAEGIVAYELEKNYTKDEILELYINIIYFGDGYYGIKEACNGYLKKDPIDMNLSEATMLAGIPNAPSVYSPTVNKDLCKKRQKKVIRSMVENEYLTQGEADQIDQSFIDNIN